MKSLGPLWFQWWRGSWTVGALFAVVTRRRRFIIEVRRENRG